MAVNRTKMRVGGGQVFREMHWGVYAFVTTGATLSVVVPLSSVEGVELLAIGAPASDEILSVNNTIVGTAGTAGCKIAGNGDGTTTLTVTRTGASKTSGLKFFLRALSGATA